MAKKRSGPGDEDADFSAFDKTDDILRLDDAALNDVFAWLDDCSALDDTLRLDDSVLNIFAWLDDVSALPALPKPGRGRRAAPALQR